jgi:hypothetical protein
MSGIVLYHVYRYLDETHPVAPLYKAIKPHLPFIVLESILPTLCLTPKDLTAWKRDPAEFVRNALGEHRATPVACWTDGRRTNRQTCVWRKRG